MVEAVFAVPGDLAALTGGYGYARKLLEGLPRLGIGVRHLPLAGAFPNPSARDLELAGDQFRAVGAGEVLLIDGLAYSAMPRLILARVRAPMVALVHHPLCREAGLSEPRRSELYQLEREALALARQVIVTSGETRRLLIEEFAVPAAKLSVAEPGTDPTPRAAGGGRPPHLLSVGAVSPRKGFDVLIAAVDALADCDWRLTIAGPLDRDPATVAALRAQIAASGVASRIRLVGAVQPDALATLYATADAFVLASRYEGYGMVLAEALAHGLPIVCTNSGGVVETLADDVVLKVPVDDPRALAAALRRVLEDQKLRQSLADASWRTGSRLPRWEETARIVADVLIRAAT